jgi:hypothetical protein
LVVEKPGQETRKRLKRLLMTLIEGHAFVVLKTSPGAPWRTCSTRASTPGCSRRCG